MTRAEINELQRLITEYDARHGDGKGDEISGALMFSFPVSEQIKIFKTAGKRKILLEYSDEVIDGIVVKYKSRTS